MSKKEVNRLEILTLVSEQKLDKRKVELKGQIKRYYPGDERVVRALLID